MPELESSLRELRDDLRSSIGRPDLRQVAGRARDRAVRRRMQIGAITAVVLVSVLVPVLRSLPTDRQSTEPPRVPMTYQVDFADPRYGYALGTACDGPEVPCAFTLLATTDRGTTWRQRTLPADGVPFASSVLLVLARNRLMLYRAPLGTGGSTELFASDDGGRTWYEHEPSPGAAGPIPAGARLQRICAGTGCPIGVGAVAADGRLAPAPAQPPVEVRVVGEVATSGGRYWVVSQVPATRAWIISVTSDTGLSWYSSTVELPAQAWLAREPWSVVEARGVLYATALGNIGTGPFGLVAVFRSFDAGVSWTRTWQATPTTLVTAVTGGPVATSDGRLLLYSRVEGTLESTDGSRFTPADRQLPGRVTWTRAGYLAEVEDNEYELSSDGLTWRRFTLP